MCFTKINLILTIMILAGASLFGQHAKQVWANFYPNTDGPPDQLAYGVAITIDAQENIYSLASVASNFEVTKIDSSGIPIWNTAVPVDSYSPTAIGLDPFGNVFISGFEHTNNSNPSGTAFWLMKIDPSGNFMWEEYIPQYMGGYSGGYSLKPTTFMEIDELGNVYLIGKDYNLNYPGPTYSKFIIRKLDNDGNPIWTSTSPGHAKPEATDISYTGKIAITGGYSSSYSYTTVYNSDGTLSWEHYEGSVASPRDVSFWNVEEVRVLTRYFGNINDDFAVLNYTNSGTLTSTSIYDTGTIELPKNLVVDSDGNNVMSGIATQSPQGGYVDWIVIKGAPNGTILWSDQYNGRQDNDEFSSARDEGLAVDDNGNVYVTGQAGPTFFGGALFSGSCVTIKYNGSTGIREFVQIDQTNMGAGVMVFPRGDHFYVSGSGQRKIVKYSNTPFDGILADLSIFLKGPYGMPTFSRYMYTDLRPYIPFSQPYNTAPWNYQGTENIAYMPASVVDWVLVELRTNINGTDAYARKAALLNSQGMITDVRGNSLRFPYPSTGEQDFYFVVYHRNHLAMMTPGPIPMNNAGIHRNSFTYPQSAYGGLPAGVIVNQGVWAEMAGDANGDGQVNAVDLNAYWSIQNGTIEGYNSADFNLDGEVNAIDKNLYWSVFNGRQSYVPD